MALLKRGSELTVKRLRARMIRGAQLVKAWNGAITVEYGYRSCSPVI